MAHIIGIVTGSEIESSLKRKGLGEFLQTKFSLTFQIESDSMSEKWTDILALEQLPQIGKPFSGLGSLKGPEAESCRCSSHKLKEVSAIQRNGKWKMLWTIEYNFDSESVESPGGIGGGLGNGTKDPRDWPVQISFESSSCTEPLLADARSGAPVVNAVGEPVFIEHETVAPVLVVTRYETFSKQKLDFIKKYLKRTNKSIFLGWGPGHVLLDDIRSSLKLVHGTPYLETTYRFLFRDDSDIPFAANILHQGTKARTETDGEIKTTAEILGKNCTVNLNHDGTVNETDVPNVLTFHTYREAEFDELGLVWPTDNSEERIQ